MTEVWRSAGPEQRGTGMTKAELVEQVAATLALPKRQAETVGDLFWQSIMDALEAGGPGGMRGGGGFWVRARRAPAGGEPQNRPPGGLSAEPGPRVKARE